MRHDPSLVNIYREILNTYFGTSPPLLENKQYFVKWSNPASPEPVAPAALTPMCSDSSGGSNGRDWMRLR